MKEYMIESIDVLAKLGKAGYRLSEIKPEFFKTNSIDGPQNNQAVIRPLQDKLLAIKELKQPNNEKN